MTTLKQVKELLKASSYSKKGDVFTVRRGFFYTHGKTSQDFVNDVLTAFPEAKVVDSGEVWKPFRGGASVTASSHWFVKFTVGVAGFVG